MDFLRRTWAEINLNALAHNLSETRRICPGKEIMAVVKANAYGHDDRIICGELRKLGVKLFAVSNLWEAEDLRQILPDGEIMIFGFTEGDNYFQSIINGGFIHTAGSTEYARRLNDYAVRHGVRFRVHIKINTGMTRVGINNSGELEEILSLPGLLCEGLFTHFAVSDSSSDDDKRYTEKQQKLFLEIAKGKGLPLHSQNSGGIINHGVFESDIVRAGLILYGYNPDNKKNPGLNLHPVMSLKSSISQIRRIERGTQVSYGRTYTAPDERLIAVVPVGYADGYPRLLSGKGSILVDGVLCPVLGRVCMDQIIIDVTKVKNAAIGGEAEIYSDKVHETSIGYISEALGTIPYEILCGVGHRVPRVAVKDGIITDVVRYG